VSTICLDNLTSYLLFDRAFCRALLAMGFADTLARRSEIVAFLQGGDRMPPPCAGAV